LFSDTVSFSDVATTTSDRSTNNNNNNNKTPSNIAATEYAEIQFANNHHNYASARDVVDPLPYSHMPADTDD
jgi:hypothetical protein